MMQHEERKWGSSYKKECDISVDKIENKTKQEKADPLEVKTQENISKSQEC